jgi:hypothetical protein
MCLEVTAGLEAKGDRATIINARLPNKFRHWFPLTNRNTLNSKSAGKTPRRIESPLCPETLLTCCAEPAGRALYNDAGEVAESKFAKILEELLKRSSP